jgi:hypothetical protein
MKIIRLSFAILSLACIAHGATNEAFEITSYFRTRGIVGIEYNGVRTNRPFSSFSSAEQQQITDWLADEEFKGSGLSVEIEEHKTSTKSDYADGDGQTKGTAETIFYEVTVVNNTDAVLNNMQIECRTFYLGDITRSQWAGVGVDKYCRINRVTLSIVPGEARRFNTSDVSIRNLKTDFPSSQGRPQATRYTKDDLEGLVVSVSRKDRNGEVHSKTYENGSPPNERDWGKYSQSARQGPRI